MKRILVAAATFVGLVGAVSAGAWGLNTRIATVKAERMASEFCRLYQRKQGDGTCSVGDKTINIQAPEDIREANALRLIAIAKMYEMECNGLRSELTDMSGWRFDTKDKSGSLMLASCSID